MRLYKRLHVVYKALTTKSSCTFTNTSTAMKFHSNVAPRLLLSRTDISFKKDILVLSRGWHYILVLTVLFSVLLVWF